MKRVKKSAIGQELRSKDAQEIMGKIPAGILLCGYILFGVIVLGLVISCYFITYPEILESEIIVSAFPTSKPVCITTNGTIVDCRVKNGTPVTRGDTIAEIKGGSFISVLESPISGYVNLHKPLHIGQTVSLNEVICSVLPDTTVTYVGSMKISSVMMNKIKCGQSVKVYLERYSHQESVFLNGKINSVSRTLDANGNAFVEVVFPKDLKTNRTLRLLDLIEIKGYAKIVLCEKKLIERFFSSVKIELN